MRTLLHIVSGDLWAGKETQLSLQLKPFLADPTLGIKINFLLFNDGEVSRRLREAGFECFVLAESLPLMQFLKQFKEIVKSVGPSAIVTHGYKESALGWLGCRGAGSAALITMFHGAPEPFSGLAGARMTFYSAIHRVIARTSAKRIITVSEALAKELGFGGNRKVRVIRNVVETTVAKPGNVGELLGGRQAIVAVGRLSPVKAFDRALRAFANLLATNPSLTTCLYVIGDGPLRSALELLASDLGISERVFFLGFRHDAAQLIALADLLMLPSLREGIPTVVLEAIRAGVPILSNELPGVREALSFFPDYPVNFEDSSNSQAWGAATAKLIGRRVLDNTRHVTVLGSEFSPTVAAEKHLAILSELK